MRGQKGTDGSVGCIRLEDLPNIGKETLRQLNELGYDTVDAFKEAGAKKVWLEFQKIDPSVCLVCLYGLEGAARNLPISKLPAEVKEDLKRFAREQSR